MAGLLASHFLSRSEDSNTSIFDIYASHRRPSATAAFFDMHTFCCRVTSQRPLHSNALAQSFSSGQQSAHLLRYFVVYRPCHRPISWFDAIIYSEFTFSPRDIYIPLMPHYFPARNAGRVRIPSLHISAASLLHFSVSLRHASWRSRARHSSRPRQ